MDQLFRDRLIRGLTSRATALRRNRSIGRTIEQLEDRVTPVVYTFPADGAADNYYVVQNATFTEVYSFDAGFGSKSLLLSKNDATQFVFNGTPGVQDQVYVDLTAGDAIPSLGITVNGNSGDGDRVYLLGKTGVTAIYDPSSTIDGDGTVTTSDGVVTFSGLDSSSGSGLDLDGFDSTSVVLPADGNAVTVASGSGYTTDPASGDPLLANGVRISGSTGGLGFTPVAAANASVLTLDMAASSAADSVTFGNADFTLAGLPQFDLLAGTGPTDAVSQGGMVTAASIRITGATDVDLSSPSNDIDSFAADIDGSLNLSDSDDLAIDLVGPTAGATATGTVTIFTGGTLTANQPISGDSGIDISALDAFVTTAGGTLTASAGSVSLNSANSITLGDTLTASGGLIVFAGVDLIASSGAGITVGAGGVFGIIGSNAVLDDVTATGSGINLFVFGDTALNGAMAGDTGVSVYSAGLLTGNAGGSVASSAASVTLTAGSDMSLADSVTAATDVYLSVSGTLSTTVGGTLTSTGGLVSTVSVGTTTIGGAISATGLVSLVSNADLTTLATGTISSSGGGLFAYTDSNMTFDGAATVATTIDLTATGFANGQGDLTVNAALFAGTTLTATVARDTTITSAGSITAVGAINTTTGRDLYINGPVTSTGSSTTMTANAPGGSQIYVNAAVSGAPAIIFGGTGSDRYEVTVVGTISDLTLNGLGANDAYFSLFGSASWNAGSKILFLNDTGGTGGDFAYAIGDSSADTINVNAPGNLLQMERGGARVQYAGSGAGGIEELYYDGKDGSDTYNIYVNTFGVALSTVADSGTVGTDTANIEGTDGLQETFRVNTASSLPFPSFASAVGYYGTGSTLLTQVNYVNGTQPTITYPITGTLTYSLEALNVYGGDEPNLIPPLASIGDTFYAHPDLYTEICLHGGLPTTSYGDTLFFDVIGLVNPVITDLSGTPGSYALPDGKVTSDSHATMCWTSIETLPVPLGFGGTFDFQTDHNPATTQPGFLPVSPTDTPTSGAYSFASVGWLNPGNGAYDRVEMFGPAGDPGGGLSLLLRDGEWGDDGGGSNNGQFQVAVAPNQTIMVTMILGDVYEGRDHMNVYVGTVGNPLGTKLNPSITTFDSAGLPHDFVSYSGMFNPGADDKIVITIETAFGGFSTFWTAAGLDIRPLGLLAPLVLSRVGGDVTVVADGYSTDQYTGTGARPYAVVTVNPQYGTPVNGSDILGATVIGDADPALKGFQIRADVNGNFAFGILRPTGLGPSIITVTDATGNGATGIIGPTSPGPLAVSPNPYVLPNPYVQTFELPTVRRIDFGPDGNPIATPSDPLDPYLYIGWSNTAYVSTVANALGWVGTSPSLLDRGSGFSDLQRDGAFNYSPATGDFRLDMPAANTTYSVTVLLGDMTNGWNGMFVQIVDPATGTLISTPFTGVNTPGGQARSLTFIATSDANGSIRVRFGIASAPPANPFWTVEAIEVRPVFGSGSPGAVAPLTLNGSTYSGSPTVLAGTVSADGLTSTNYSITNATPNSLVTVEVSIGTNNTTDVGTTYVGIQVLADSFGNASFTIISPYATAATTSTITISEVTGAKLGVFVQNYVGSPVAPPVVQRFDFNSGTSPTLAGFTGVLNNTLYNSTLGYGWKAAVSGYDRGSGGNPVDLYRDGAWQGSGSGTFQVSVGAGQSREVRVYVGDPYAAWSGVRVTVEGNPTPVVVDPTVSRFGYVTVTGSDANSDGIFTVTVSQASGSTWVVSGMDIATPGNLPATATPVATPMPVGGYRFDFNGSANNTTAAVGFVGLRGNNTYTPATGYGWASAVSELERTVASMPGTMTADQKSLYRDAAWGSGTARFVVATTAGSTVSARVYVGDSYTNWPNITLRIEGNPTPVATNTTATPFAGYVLANGFDENGDGVVTITITGGSTWVANGLDIVYGPPGNLPGLPVRAELLARPQTATPTALSADELNTIAAEAIRRWAATGISPEQEAILRGLTVRIGNPGGDDYLGSYAPGVVTIAPTAGGIGWFVDSTPADDVEYGVRVASTEVFADSGAAAGRYDLLTVVMHEMGHALGRDDLNAQALPHDLMAENIRPGLRRVPASIITVSAANPEPSVAVRPVAITAPEAARLPVESVTSIPAASELPVATTVRKLFLSPTSTDVQPLTTSRFADEVPRWLAPSEERADADLFLLSGVDVG